LDIGLGEEIWTHLHLCRPPATTTTSGHNVSMVLVVQWLSVGLVIERSLVRLPAGELSSQQDHLSLPSLQGR